MDSRHPAQAARPEERFRPTSGRLTGGIALAVAGAVALSGLAGDELAFPVPARLFAVVVVVVVWAAALRPRVELSGPDLVLRGMVTDTRIPLAAIEEVFTRQTFVVTLGTRTYISPALNRTMLALRAAGKNLGAGVPQVGYVDYVEDKVRAAMADERVRLGIPARSPAQRALADQVRRTPAWPEIVALTAAVVAFVVSLLL